MIVARSIDKITREKNSVVTVGTFDGVHLAHQEIVREVVQRAKLKEGRSVVITFDPHPKEVVGNFKEPIHLLTTIEERIELLRSLDVDLLFIVDFTLAFSKLSSREFYERYLQQGIGVVEVIVGYDHKFGNNRQGTAEDLVRMGESFDFSVYSFHPYTVDGEVVSSTQIRRALAAGNVEKAQMFLGRPYSFSALVIKGDGRGKTIGYPTANMQMRSEKKMLPAHGVYLVEALVGGARRFGMMNIGVRPTVNAGGNLTLEVHLFDFEQDLYGQEITVSLLKRIRDENKFASLQELTRQLEADKETSLRHLSQFTTTKVNRSS